MNTIKKKCESCGKSFSLAKDLKRHIQTLHKGHKDTPALLCLHNYLPIFNVCNYFVAQWNIKNI